MIAEELKILDDFPPVSYDAWKSKAVADLKGVPFEKKMITHTYDGIDIQPIYTPESWSSANDPSGFPGSPPYTRGTRPLGQSLNGWDVRQEVLHPEPAEVNRIVLDELEHGVTSVELKLDAAASAGLDADDSRSAERCGREGVMVYSLGDLDQALNGVQMDVVPISLEAGAAFLPAAALLAALWEEKGVKSSQAMGSFNADPLGTLMRDGTLPHPLDVTLLQMTDLAAWTTCHLPNVSSVRVSTAVYHHAGSNSIQDLAFAVGTAVEYLRAMTAVGLEVNAAVSQIAFHETVGCKFFQSIAKLRALRKLWAKALEACGADMKTASGLRLVVETSRRVITHRSPWVNLLRNTAACFAGAVGGADAIITLPMDVAVGLSDESTRRLARNVQLILQEECHLNQTVDPAGGSWFLEKLTDEMAEKAWSLFQQVEGLGGMVKAATSGWIGDQIQAVEKRREQDAATRKAVITGVSEHVDVFEKDLSRPTPNYAELRAKAAGRLVRWRHGRGQGNTLAALAAVVAKSGRGSGELMASAVKAALAGATIGELTSTLAGPGANRQGASAPPLAAHPYAAAYEELRDLVDVYARAQGDKRPKVFLANLGTRKEFLARGNYARDFFEAGGFEPVDNDGFTDAQAAAAAFAASQAAIAVICSTDARYATEVEQVAPKLVAAGAKTVVLAGNPGANEAKYRAAGVNQFIFIKCNVLEILRSLLQRIGVLS
jgi:methylmalonyl-CoA mutase